MKKNKKSDLKREHHHNDSDHNLVKTSENKKKKLIKNKILWIGIVLVIVVVAIGIYYYSASPYKIKREVDLLSYKKGLYEAVICQYSCPLKIQTYQNKTQLLPDLNCVKDCTTNFKNKFSAKSLTTLNFSKEELNNDNFFKDIELTVDNCKKQNTDSTLAINNSNFFSCVSSDLGSIKNKYNYLNKI